MYAYVNGGTAYGVEAFADAGQNAQAVRGVATGSSALGVIGINFNSASGAYAGYFIGKGYFAQALTKAGGGFLIDHPLDPANKKLTHSFVESPDMKNIYDGIAVTDANGEVTIQMPAYFDALNMEFRYQLTAVGAPAAALHVKEKLANGQFTIAGAPAGQEVSWQVTGIRKDAWAQANRLAVEEDKQPNERGLYLAPEAFGLPREKAVYWENIVRSVDPPAPMMAPDSSETPASP